MFILFTYRKHTSCHTLLQIHVVLNEHM